MPKVTGIPRGIRNNNPFNIRHNPANTWEGMTATQTDPDFVQFTDMVYGVRAGVRLFLNYRRLYGHETVEKIISRHAPSSENDTEAFIRFVCSRLGVRRDEKLDLDSEEVLVDLANAVIWMENGGYEVPEEVVRRGVRMALRPRTAARAVRTGRVPAPMAVTIPTATAGAMAAVAPQLWGLDWRVAVTVVVVVAVAAVAGVLLWRARRD